MTIYPKLDPCPFCGGPAYVDSPFPHADSPDYYVYHDDQALVDYSCPASTFTPGTRTVRRFKTVLGAVNSWNCRLMKTIDYVIEHYVHYDNISVWEEYSVEEKENILEVLTLYRELNPDQSFRAVKREIVITLLSEVEEIPHEHNENLFIKRLGEIQ